MRPLLFDNSTPPTLLAIAVMHVNDMIFTRQRVVRTLALLCVVVVGLGEIIHCNSQSVCNSLTALTALTAWARPLCLELHAARAGS